MLIEFKGLELEIDAVVDLGLSATYESPEDEPRVEIQTILWNGKQVTDLVLELVTGNDLAKLEELIIKEYRNQ